jgi:hypothetical protein
MAQSENEPSGATHTGSATIRSTIARQTGSHLWVSVDFDEPLEITGITSRGNRRLHDQLWSELGRIGATKTQSPESFIKVAGEAGMGTFVSWWSSAVLIGIEMDGRRVFAFSGTGAHAADTWTGEPRNAFALLAQVADGAGAAGFWGRFAADTGYAEAAPPG